jgi:hypothetical protein
MAFPGGDIPALLMKNMSAREVALKSCAALLGQ